MVDTEFTTDLTTEEIEDLLNRFQPTGTIRPLDTSLFKWDKDSETLKIEFSTLERILLEYHQYDQAEGFTDNEVTILRVVEQGPNRMGLNEIKNGLKEEGIELADSTLYQYLRELIEKGLISRKEKNQYNYIGP